MDTSLEQNEEEKEDLFGAAFESYDSDVRYDNVEFRWWDSETHKDLRGESYKGAQNYYLSISNTFNSLVGSSIPLTVDLHLTLNPDCKGEKFFSGDVVVESQSAGSNSSADITILVDGNVTWECPVTITGTTVEPQHFELELTDAKTEVVIRVESMVTQQGIALGFVNMIDAVN